jgi:hypothetical protein
VTRARAARLTPPAKVRVADDDTSRVLYPGCAGQVLVMTGSAVYGKFLWLTLDTGAGTVRVLARDAEPAE